MEDDKFADIFWYCVCRRKPEQMKGKDNKNKWKSFKKKCKNFKMIFSRKSETWTLEAGTLFRNCWSPKYKRSFLKIVMKKNDLQQI